jgi:hypothetical protein
MKSRLRYMYCRFPSGVGFPGWWCGLAWLSMLVVGGGAGLETRLSITLIPTTLSTASPRQQAAIHHATCLQAGTTTLIWSLWSSRDMRLSAVVITGLAALTLSRAKMQNLTRDPSPEVRRTGNTRQTQVLHFRSRESQSRQPSYTWLSPNVRRYRSKRDRIDVADAMHCTRWLESCASGYVLNPA